MTTVHISAKLSKSEVDIICYLLAAIFGDKGSRILEKKVNYQKLYSATLLSPGLVDDFLIPEQGNLIG